MAAAVVLPRCTVRFGARPVFTSLSIFMGVNWNRWFEITINWWAMGWNWKQWILEEFHRAQDPVVVLDKPPGKPCLLHKEASPLWWAAPLSMRGEDFPTGNRVLLGFSYLLILELVLDWGILLSVALSLASFPRRLCDHASVLHTKEKSAGFI